MPDPVASLRGRIGAFAQHAQHDPRETTKAARRSFLESFEEKVDPDGVLAVEERQRRAKAALNEHMSRLALKSAKARAARSVKT